MKYKVKMIIAGDVVEVYKYGRFVRTGKDLTTFRTDGGTPKEKKEIPQMEKDEKNLRDSLRRTRFTLTRLINANVGKWGERDKFFTLTFKENITDHAQANKLFTEFMKRLNRKLFKKQTGLKYVCVVERQERGALHYHVVLFNMPYVPQADLLALWGHGGAHITAIEHVDNLGVYVVKYIEKTMHDMECKKSAKEKDKKLYFASRGLHKPVQICDATEQTKGMINMFEEEMANHKVYSKVYENEHYETFEVNQYNASRQEVQE